MTADLSLPGPSGHDVDNTPWWQLANGERVYAIPGSVYTPGGSEHLASIEWDALVMLAAVAHARGEAAA